MEKIATDTYSFERLRTEGCVYVDKTALLKQLADGSIGTQFFIARPRRFGKSLAVSTLQCLFEGRRDLFKGLAIENDWNWEKTWPVLHLDMSSCQAATVEKLWEKIDDLLVSGSERLEIPLRGKSASSRFRFLIEDLAKRNREQIISGESGAAASTPSSRHPAAFTSSSSSSEAARSSIAPYLRGANPARSTIAPYRPVGSAFRHRPQIQQSNNPTIQQPPSPPRLSRRSGRRATPRSTSARARR